MAAGTEASQAIAERFGENVLDAQGGVDRRMLAPLVCALPLLPCADALPLPVSPSTGTRTQNTWRASSCDELPLGPRCFCSVP